MEPSKLGEPEKGPTYTDEEAEGTKICRLVAVMGPASCRAAVSAALTEVDRPLASCCRAVTGRPVMRTL